VPTKYGEATLERYSADVGVPYETIKRLRSVAAAYPQTGRRLPISWSVHQALAAQDDRLELVAARDDWTVAQARELVEQRKNPPVKVEVLISGVVETREIPGPRHPHKFTEQSPEGGISWAHWSWNPVTGCLHGCP
jgi:hypothetical protein